MTRSAVMIGLLCLNGLAVAENCNEIENDQERLACYDARDASPHSEAAGDAPAPPPAPARPEEVPQPVEPVDEAGIVEAEAPQEFGRKEATDDARQYVEGVIVEIRKAGTISYIRLDNGQVWRELSDSGMRFKEGRKVRITEGILGSYDLQMEGRSKIVKVRRAD